jgi:hypothetical protein
LEVAPAARVSRKDEVPIEPIRVALVAVSGDSRGKGKGAAESRGDWLATVDSRADTEIYLKFWKWNVGPISATGNATTTTTASKLCTLNTRIDRPHGDHRVTSIAFHPAGAEVLATTGEDGLVKMWGVRRTPEEGRYSELVIIQGLTLPPLNAQLTYCFLSRVLDMCRLVQLPEPHPFKCALLPRWVSSRGCTWALHYCVGRR